MVVLLVPFVGARVTREDLAALRALDETGQMDKLSAASQLALLDSFLEVDNNWWWSRRSRSRGYSPPPPPPPRRRHDPCECDMPSQDALTNECLSRRFQYLMTDFAALSTDTAYGYTIEGSRAALRDPHIAFENAYTVSHNNATSLYYNMTNSINGSIPLADQAVKHLLTMEYFWVLSVNNAYMNLLNVTNDQFMKSVEGIENLQDDLMTQMSTWFSGLQQNQDNSTTDNLQSVYDSIVATLTDDVTELNSQLYTGWDVLNQAGSSMNNSNITTAALAASLASALDSIAVGMTNLSTIDLPSANASMAAKVAAFLKTNLLSYNTTGNGVISSFNSAASGKQSQYQSSSALSINSTSSFQRGLLASQYNSTMSSLAALMNTSNATDNITWSTFYSPLLNSLSSNISNISSHGTGGVAGVRNALGVNSQFQSTLQSQLTNLTVLEQKYVSNSNSKSVQMKSNATNTVNQFISSLGSQMAKDLTLVNSIGLAAPDAVGSDTFSNLADMSEQVNAMDGQLGDAANAAAAESKYMGAALADAARQGMQAVASAGQSIVNQIGSSANGAFGDANAVAGSLVNGTKSVPTSSVNSALSAAQTSALAAVQAQMDTYVTSASMTNQSVAENMTWTILYNLQQQGISADDAIVGLRAYIAQAGTTNSYTVNFANQTDNMIGTYLSGAATGVYQTMVTFTSQMQSAVDNFKQNMNVPSTGGNLAGVAANDLAKIQSDFDSSFSNYNGTNVTVDTDGMNQSVTSQTQFVQDQLNNTVVNAQVDLDSFLASSSSAVSDSTTARLSEVNALKASSNITIGGISVAQMDQIRAVAANVDTLMRKLNDFIGSQNTPLYNQIVNLPARGQNFFQQIQAFNAAAYAIEQGDPLGMDDLVKFGINPDPDIADLALHVSETSSAGMNNLSSISAFFNRSANAYWNDYSVLSESFGKTFESLVTSLQADLAAASAAAQSDSPNAIRDAGILSAISTISGQIQNLANKAGQVGSGTQLVVPYPELSKLMSESVGVVNNASESSYSASSIVDQLNSVASSVSQEMSSVNGSSMASQVKLHAASLAMQSGLILSKMSETSATMNQTQTDAMSVINSYAQQAAASASLLASQSESVSQAVVTAQANMANAMGRIAQKFASLDLPSDFSSQSDQIQSNLIMLRSTLSQLMAAFDSYLSNQRMRFTGASTQLNSTNANVLFNAKQKMTGVDINLSSNKTSIAQDIEDLQSAISWYGNDADLKVPTDTLRSHLENFYNREIGEIQDEMSEINNIPTDNSDTLETVESSVSSAIESMAAQAVSMIQSYQLPVPSRLEDYASSGIEAVAR